MNASGGRSRKNRRRCYKIRLKAKCDERCGDMVCWLTCLQSVRFLTSSERIGYPQLLLLLETETCPDPHLSGSTADENEGKNRVPNPSKNREGSGTRQFRIGSSQNPTFASFFCAPLPGACRKNGPPRPQALNSHRRRWRSGPGDTDGCIDNSRRRNSRCTRRRFRTSCRTSIRGPGLGN